MDHLWWGELALEGTTPPTRPATDCPFLDMSLYDPLDPRWREPEGTRLLREQLRQTDEIRRSMTAYQVSFPDLSRMAGESERLRQLARDLARPVSLDFEQFDAMRRAALDAQEQFRASRLLGDSVQDAIARVLGDTQAWTKQARVFDAEWVKHSALERQLMQSAAATYTESLRRTTELLALVPDFRLRPETASFLLAPTEGFGRYAPGALERAAEATDNEARVGAEVGVALAERQLADAGELQEELLESVASGEVPGTAMEPAPARASSLELVVLPSRRVELFFTAQEADALASFPLLVAPDGRAMVDVVPMARAAEARRDLGRLLLACRKDAVLRQLEPPFRQTDAVSQFLLEIAFLDPRTRDGLAALMNGLYFALYEASDDGQRLHRYLPETACTPVRRVQRLRNRVFSHASDLEPAYVLARQAPETLADLRALGLEGEPQSSAECQRFHDRLVGDVTSFLQELREQVRAKG